MKKLSRIFTLLLILGLAFSLFACQPKDPTDDPNKGKEEQVTELDLIDSEKKATFSVVYTAASGAKAEGLAKGLVDLLNQLEVTDGKAQIDTNADAVKDCEVIIGVNPKNRGEKVLADKKTVGEKDWKVELVGKRVLIYGGSDAALQGAYDYFTGSVLKLKNSSSKVKSVTIEAATFGKESRLLDSFTVNGADLKEFFIVYDGTVTNGQDLRNAAYDLQTALQTLYGIDLPVKSKSEVPDQTEKIFLLTNKTDSGDTGFRVRSEGKSLILEYQYTDASFKRVFGEMLEGPMTEFKGDVAITGDKTVFTVDGKTLCYEDYGAKGDGKTDDSAAIRATHVAANQAVRPVKGNDKATYYIGGMDAPIPVKTAVDWGDANFIIDDRTLEGWQRVRDVFRVESMSEDYKLTDEELAGKSIAAGASNIGFGVNFSKAVVLLVNKDHLQFIRWGVNFSASSDMFKTQEVVVVDKDGNVDPTTPVLYQYDHLTEVRVFPVDDTTLTLKGGHFTTYANAAPNDYSYYYRGIQVMRSNTVVKEMTHKVEKEYSNGDPYFGFFVANYATNVEFRDIEMQARKTYKDSAGTSMGSYDTAAMLANDIRWYNCIQKNSLTSSVYWGVHTSDWTKNLYVEGCEFNRVDAHTGVHNFEAVDTKIGFDINMIGSGDLKLTRVVKISGRDFIHLREDYGSTWNGDVFIKDCEHQGFQTVEADSTTARDSVLYLYRTSFKKWDFGYTTYMPQNTYIDGLVCGDGGKATMILFYFSENTLAEQFTPDVNSEEELRVKCQNAVTGADSENLMYKSKSLTITKMNCKSYDLTNNNSLLRPGDLKITDNRPVA